MNNLRNQNGASWERDWHLVWPCFVISFKEKHKQIIRRNTAEQDFKTVVNMQKHILFENVATCE